MSIEFDDKVATRPTARQLAAQQKQISIGEFFEKNKHFLGFDTPQRAFITAVKEGVDNSLDACEEAGILPVIEIEIRRSEGDSDVLEMIIRDKGPGIPRASIANVFGKLLFGSRFHAVRQSRGQQGIGITGVVMYSQLSTGRTVEVTTKIAEEETALRTRISLDTKKNKAVKHEEERFIWFEDDFQPVEHGVQIHAHMRAKYIRGKKSVENYLRMTSIVNPHADIKLIDPDGVVHHWPAVTDKLPRATREIKPHPDGMEIGMLMRMAHDSTQPQLKGFLRRDFSGVSMRAAERVCDGAEVKRTMPPKKLGLDHARGIITALNKEKLSPPSTDCLSPIEGILIKKGLAKAIDSQYAVTLTRNPEVASGAPFQIEVGLVFGGDLPGDGQVQILRFANRVPLLYQQGGCMLTKALESVDWRQYGLEQRGGKGIPHGPAAVLLHLASTNVQFTSEAKEAVADNEVIHAEVRKALLELGRGLRSHLKKKERGAKSKEKFELVREILPEIAERSARIVGKSTPDLGPVITTIMKSIFCEVRLESATQKQSNNGVLELHFLNYTERSRSFEVFARLDTVEPDDIISETYDGEWELEGLRKWNIPDIESGGELILSIVLAHTEGMKKSDLDIFVRSSVEIIGTETMDEEMLQQLKSETQGFISDGEEE